MGAEDATVLKIHIASIEDIIRKYKIPPLHIANLDEAGITPNRETKGKFTGNVVIRRRIRAIRGRSNYELRI